MTEKKELCVGCLEPPKVTRKQLKEIAIKKEIAKIVKKKTALSINDVLDLVQNNFGNRGLDLAGFVIAVHKNMPAIYTRKDREDMIQYLTGLAQRHNHDWTVLNLLRKFEILRQ